MPIERFPSSFHKLPLDKAMPVHCPIRIESLSTDEFRKFDYHVMRHAFDSQNDLGRLADERIYQADLAARLQSFGVGTLHEVPITLSYAQFTKTLYLDLVVEEKGVYELKAVKAITDAHFGQLLTYLYLLDLPRGKLINFGGKRVESNFVNAPLRTDTRRSFEVADRDYRGNSQFKELVIELLRDWGTSLTLALYQEALAALLSGFIQSEVMLPLCRDGVELGNQRFQLADHEVAFKLTSFNSNAEVFEQQLRLLIRHSPLKAIHWVNIGHEIVTLKTLAR